MQGRVPVDNALKHGVNNLVIAADVALTRVPYVSYHFQAGLLQRMLSPACLQPRPRSPHALLFPPPLQVQMWYGSAYLLFMWAWHGLSSRWVYRILDWSTPLSVLLYLALPLLNAAAFAVWCAHFQGKPLPCGGGLWRGLVPKLGRAAHAAPALRH